MKTNKSLFQNLLFAGLFSVSLLSCDTETKNGQIPDTPVSGQIKISIDEALKPFADSEVKTFMQIYKDAKLTASFKPENQVLDDLFKDSARAIIIPRPLNKEELKYYDDKKLKVKMVKIAYDAIAIIVNKDNPDSNLTMMQLSDILNGKTTSWSQINGNKNKINVVFDNQGSSTVEYIRNRFNIKNMTPENFYAVKSNEEIINYVEKNPGAIGFLGVNWLIGDEYKPNTFLGQIRVVGLNPPDTAKDADQAFYLPYQAWIQNSYYPLVREVYGITPEFFNGLGSGFITFMAGDKGQLVALHAGMVPATMPIRKVHIKHEY